MEQSAGRAANEANGRDHKILTGKEELQRRFGAAVLTASWEWRNAEDDEHEGYWADVIIQPADGANPMVFTERLEHFPSDECVTNIALVT